MKPSATSEMILNILRHEYPQTNLSDLILLSSKLQRQNQEKTRRFTGAPSVEVSKQKLSKPVLKSMRQQNAPGPREAKS